MKNQELLACAAGVSGPATSCRPQPGHAGSNARGRPYASQAARGRAEGRGGALEGKTVKEEDGKTLSDRFPIIPHDQPGGCCGCNRRVRRH